MAHIAVVGGGAAGLTAALGVRRNEHRVTLFEAGDRVGGVIRTVRQHGFLGDLGPNSMLAPPPAVRSLLRDLGISQSQLDSSAAARRRYVIRGGRPRAMPASGFAFLTTPLLSFRSKVRLLAEPFNRSRPSSAEESLAELVRRRLGQDLVDYALNPLVAGVYAGDPEQLSSIHSMPILGSLEARYGSLLGGAIRMMRERRSDRKEPEGRLFSFHDGMETLPRALASSLAPDLRLRTRVTKLAPIEGSWLLTLDGPGGPVRQLFDAVICAAPAHALATMEFEGRELESWRSLERVRYTPIAVVVSGYQRDDVTHPLDGFGALVPEVEHRETLGTLFSSTLFTGRAPEGHVTLTTFVGGARQPELALAGEATITAAVERDLRDLLGARGTPVFRVVQVWPRAIPQYNLGYSNNTAAMDRIENANPGLFLAGSYRNGVSVGDVMTSGALAARAAHSLLGPAGAVGAEMLA
jgi:oxygen-dependent protoporphyrinogen oxidase